MDKFKRNRYITAGISFVVIVVVIYLLFIFQKGPKEAKKDEDVFDVKGISELGVEERPFVSLTPTTDGAEILVSMENMGKFDNIEYELTYLADNPQIPGEKIQRGATGTDVNTKEAKYKKSVLLGTASKGVRSPDKGIEDGKLLLHLFKGDIQYDSETQWTMLQIGSKPQTIEDVGGNFKLEAPGFTKDYWLILSDTVGIPMPKDFEINKVTLPAYGTFSIAPKFAKKGNLSIKVNGEGDYELRIYNQNDSSWGKPDSTYNKASKTLTSKVEFFSTFVVVAK